MLARGAPPPPRFGKQFREQPLGWTPQPRPCAVGLAPRNDARRFAFSTITSSTGVSSGFRRRLRRRLGHRLGDRAHPADRMPQAPATPPLAEDMVEEDVGRAGAWGLA